LYHSSAILLPDGSVLIAGSNPNIDVNTSTVFPTTYQAEIFYPPYFLATTRPAPTGMPQTISYGGNPFDITIPASSYSGPSNDAADSATVVIMRGGFTTHSMNMGQRLLQLNNTYTVSKNGSITLHVSQAPPNPNLFQPGPALMFVNVNGIPSNGSYLIVGSGQIGTQPTSAAGVLPINIRLSSASGTASSSSTGGKSTETKKLSNVALIAIIAGGGTLVAIVVVAGIIIAVRRKRAARIRNSRLYAMGPGNGAFGKGNGAVNIGAISNPRAIFRTSDSSDFLPLQQTNSSSAWSSTPSFSSQKPYYDYYDSEPHKIPQAADSPYRF
jgi:hypothetical protein